MCRALLYAGQPLLLDHLLYAPDSSLVKQSFNPQMLHMLNLAGFGMLAWDQGSHDADAPFRYHATRLPIFDRNLKSLASKVRASCVLAHVRGVAYRTEVQVSEQNTHPFYYPGAPVALAHNGDLYRVNEYRPSILRHIRPEFAAQIAGTTDSELMYALLLSMLPTDGAPLDAQRLGEAVLKMFDVIAAARREAGVAISSSVNLFVTDGVSTAAIRYCFDFGCYRTEDPGAVHEANLNYLSLWYTIGQAYGLHEGEWKMVGGDDEADSVIIASEPLTQDVTTWLEIPPYSMLYVDRREGDRAIDCIELSL